MQRTRRSQQALPRFGTKVIPVDLSNSDNLDRVLTERTRMVYFETPVNPLSRIIDIAAIAERAHARGVKVAFDSNFALLALQRPLEDGANLVLHSLTKYITGHGDTAGRCLAMQIRCTSFPTGLRVLRAAQDQERGERRKRGTGDVVGFDGARTMIDRLQLITRTVSLGDADSLICHPASLNRARQAIRKNAHLPEGVTEDLIRLSLGLEMKRMFDLRAL
ncbi:PLP-dependent transferase [Mesorhizobium sp. WSM2239]|uniref:PLP-dependent transferase n=2 Tax=unclassified Mesorhizobium TaxID=325217 RepID=A0AAU8D709_9HYPH